MRKLVVFGVLVTALFGFAPTVSASPAVPTCLIINGGSGGRFTKSLLCVELRNLVDGLGGSGSYAPGDTTTWHWLTESVEYRPIGVNTPVWLPLAAVTQMGTGKLEASTRPVRMPAPGVLRACTRVGDASTASARELCTDPDRTVGRP